MSEEKEDLSDFFDHFHDHYNVIEPEQSKAGKAKNPLNESGKNTSRGSTKRSTQKTVKTSSGKTTIKTSHSQTNELISSKLSTVKGAKDPNLKYRNKVKNCLKMRG